MRACTQRACRPAGSTVLLLASTSLRSSAALRVALCFCLAPPCELLARKLSPMRRADLQRACRPEGHSHGRRPCARSEAGMAEPEPKEEAMLVLSAGTPDMLLRPCSDCGRRTGNFCETRLQKDKQRWQGGVCLAAVTVPSEVWAKDQRTPLCTSCEEKHGACRFCRGVIGCAPFPRG